MLSREGVLPVLFEGLRQPEGFLGHQDQHLLGFPRGQTWQQARRRAQAPAFRVDLAAEVLEPGRPGSAQGIIHGSFIQPWY